MNRIKYENIELTFHRLSKFKSFKVTLPITMVDRVLSQESWPEGITSKPWKTRHVPRDVGNFKTVNSRYLNNDNNLFVYNF